MEKHSSITSILKKLKEKTKFNLVEIVNDWDGDLCAIGIRKDNKLVYISTFNYIDEQYLLIDYDFELIQEGEKIPLNVLKEERGVDIKVFIEDLKDFLDI